MSGEWFDYVDAVNTLSSERPELVRRLGKFTRVAQKASLVDNMRAYEVLGVPPVISWKKSVADTIDTLLNVEKEREKAGIDVESTLKNSNRRV